MSPSKLAQASLLGARPLTGALLFGSLLGLSGACSEADSQPISSVNGGQGGSSGSGGSAGNSGAGGAAGFGGSAAAGGSLIIDSGPSDGLDPDAACGLVTERAQALPLALYLMVDKSNSMEGYKWGAVEAGITAFVQDSGSAGIQMGVSFYPLAGPASCDQTLYREPTVPFGALPGHASQIIAAVNAQDPDGFGTPTYPALGGAILKGIQNAQNDPLTTQAVLLITDGNPQWPIQPPPLCGGVNPDATESIAGLARAGYDFNPSVTTFVVGLEGVQTQFANAVAAAGGSGQAILISNTNAAQELTQALKKIRGQALPCEYTLPEDVAQGTIAYDRVNVLLTEGAGGPETLPQSDDCGDGGSWRYDDPSAPTQILLCPAACERVKESYEAQLDILLGCKTERVK